MGDKGILENSVTLTKLDGVPYIPGSAIKGLVGAVARSGLFQVAGGVPLSDLEQEIITGTVANASYFTFHDAWYAPGENDKPLVLDVMTPHHQKYNANRGVNRSPRRGEDPYHNPSDTDDPIPVNFLSTRGTFLFVIQGPDAHWAHLVRSLLVFGLQHLGIGAKTSSGYGRFAAPSTTAPNPYEMDDLLVEIRSLDAADFQDRAESLVDRIVDADERLGHIATTALGQQTRELGQIAWVQERELADYLNDGFREFLKP